MVLRINDGSGAAAGAAPLTAFILVSHVRIFLKDLFCSFIARRNITHDIMGAGAHLFRTLLSFHIAPRRPNLRGSWSRVENLLITVLPVYWARTRSFYLHTATVSSRSSRFHFQHVSFSHINVGTRHKSPMAFTDPRPDDAPAREKFVWVTWQLSHDGWSPGASHPLALLESQLQSVQSKSEYKKPKYA